MSKFGGKVADDNLHTTMCPRRVSWNAVCSCGVSHQTGCPAIFRWQWRHGYSKQVDRDGHHVGEIVNGFEWVGGDPCDCGVEAPRDQGKYGVAPPVGVMRVESNPGQDESGRIRRMFEESKGEPVTCGRCGEPIVNPGDAIIAGLGTIDHPWVHRDCNPAIVDRKWESVPDATVRASHSKIGGSTIGMASVTPEITSTWVFEYVDKATATRKRGRVTAKDRTLAMGRAAAVYGDVMDWAEGIHDMRLAEWPVQCKRRPDTKLEIRKVRSFDLVNVDDKSVAYCLVTDNWSDGVFLWRLFVPKEHRRKGFARELVLRVRDEVKKPVYLETKPWGDEEVTEEELRAFYSAIGFVDAEDEQRGVMVLRDKRIDTEQFIRDFEAALPPKRFYGGDPVAKFGEPLTWPILWNHDPTSGLISRAWLDKMDAEILQGATPPIICGAWVPAVETAMDQIKAVARLRQRQEEDAIIYGDPEAAEPEGVLFADQVDDDEERDAQEELAAEDDSYRKTTYIEDLTEKAAVLARQIGILNEQRDAIYDQIAELRGNVGNGDYG